MSDAVQLALMAGIPVDVRDGEVRVRCTDATFNYLTSPRTEITVGPFCRCRSFRLPHDIRRHAELRGRDYDWRTWQERGDNGDEPAPARRRDSFDARELNEWNDWKAARTA